MDYVDTDGWSSFLTPGTTVELASAEPSATIGSIPGPLHGHIVYTLVPDVRGEVLDVLRNGERLVSVTVRFGEHIVTVDGYRATFLRPLADHPWWTRWGTGSTFRWLGGPHRRVRLLLLLQDLGYDRSLAMAVATSQVGLHLTPAHRTRLEVALREAGMAPSSYTIGP